MVNSKKTYYVLVYLIGIFGLILINQISSDFFLRLDLTEEKRYSLKPATIELLQNLDDRVYIEVYLDGDLNSGFTRLQKSVAQTLKEFERVSSFKVIYKFINPETARGAGARNEFISGLADKGITPTNVIDTREGKREEKIVFPGALVAYGGREKGVMLLSGSRGEQELNNSIENIEFNLIKTIYQLTAMKRPVIGFIKGHGESGEDKIISFQNVLYEYYEIEEIDLDEEDSLSADVIVISKPESEYSEKEKYAIDQYIMRGGKALFLMDKLEARMDSTSREFNYAFPYKTDLDDMLFQYGVRINNDLIQDNSAALFPVVVGTIGDEPQIRRLPWPYYLVINGFSDHPITKNMGAVLGRFASSIDTVKAEGIEKTILAYSSQYSRSVSSPVNVSISEIRNELTSEKLNQPNIPLAVLLEGRFESVFKNRFLPENSEKDAFKDQGEPTAIIVVSDGDMAENYTDPSTGEPLPLGEYPFQREIKFNNQQFLINAVSFLADSEGIISARNREVKIRPLDKIRIAEGKTKWQLVNILFPLLVLFTVGFAIYIFRKSKNTGFIK